MGKRKRKADRAKSNRHQERFRTFLVTDTDVSEKRKNFFQNLVNNKSPAVVSLLYAVKTELLRVAIVFENQVSVETIGPLLAYRTYNSELITNLRWPQVQASTLKHALASVPEPTVFGIDPRKKQKVN